VTVAFQVIACNMQYSSYVALMAGISIFFFLLFAAVIFSIAGPAGWGFVLFLGFILLLGFGMSIAWAHRAVSEFGGSPFPGLWGILGFDIEPDDDDTSPMDSGALGPGGVPAEDSSPPPNRVLHGCAKCGAVTEGGDARFCRVCGAPLSPSPT